MLAVRAHEVAHILDHAYDVYFHLAKHFDGFARILQRHVGWCRHYDGSSQWNGLNERERYVSRARGEIDDKVIEFTPHDRAQELPDDRMQHGAAPDQRLV